MLGTAFVSLYLCIVTIKAFWFWFLLCGHGQTIPQRAESGWMFSFQRRSSSPTDTLPPHYYNYYHDIMLLLSCAVANNHNAIMSSALLPLVVVVVVVVVVQAFHSVAVSHSIVFYPQDFDVPGCCDDPISLQGINSFMIYKIIRRCQAKQKHLFTKTNT